MKKGIVVIMMFCFGNTNAQEVTNAQITKAVAHYMDSINKVESSNEITHNWYDKFSIRGYIQVRYNGLFSTNDKVSCEQCDKSWGTTSTEVGAKSNNGFFIRRTRIIFSGQILPNVFFIQPDFASSPSSGVNNFVQLRDTYFDLSFDQKKEYRIRIGQSKIPYSFENMQSNQNGLTLDRNDGLNSAIPKVYKVDV